MSKPKIAIIIGSTRDVRYGIKPAEWVHAAASKRSDMEVELVDLKDFPLPFFNEKASNAWVPTEDETGRRWQEKVAGFDGYIFVTPEYNRSIPAALKNALDFAYPEWNRKAAAFVGYGSLGGARAVEHLRTIAIELQLAATRTGVHIQGADFMATWQQGKELAEIEHLQPNVTAMLDELSWWAAVLKAGRAKDQLLEAAE